MVNYTEEEVRDKVSRFGEAFIVLDSGEKYECHGTEQLSFKEAVAGHTEVRVEGTRDGVLIISEFPLDAIEHIYTHREI